MLRALLYAGLSKNDYDLIEPRIREDDRQALCVYSSLLAIVMLCLLIVGAFVPALRKYRVMYAVTSGLGIAVYVSARLVRHASTGTPLYLLLYLAVSGALAGGILLGTVIDPGNLTTVYTVLLFAVPLLFTDKPWKMDTVLLLSVIVYLLLAARTQSQRILMYNVANVVPFALAALIVSTYMMCRKVRHYRLRRENRILLSVMDNEGTLLTGKGHYELSAVTELVQAIMVFHSDESTLHCRRVGEYTRILCRSWNRRHREKPIAEENIELIAVGARLHDIGKLYIPDEILHKKDPLTEAEKEIVRRHTVVGASLIDHVATICHVDQPILHNIVLYHHERTDGSGYPEKRSGGQIPLEAQLVGIAEVYDALTAKALGSKTVTHEEAVALILDGRCGAFAADILTALSDAGDELRMIAESKKEDRVALLGRAYEHDTKAYWVLKRTCDVVASVAALIVLAPLLALIALWIKLDDPRSPVIFRQIRIGRHKKPFTMYKFRTMVPNAEELLKQMQAQNEKDGPVFKIKKDPRITRPGRFLRRTSLDELPQLVNIIKGDMSVVGPRPPLPSEVERYSRYHELRLSVTPGLTCFWQTHAERDNVLFEDWMDMDVAYIGTRSASTDLRIILKTIGAVMKGTGN